MQQVNRSQDSIHEPPTAAIIFIYTWCLFFFQNTTPLLQDSLLFRLFQNTIQHLQHSLFINIAKVIFFWLFQISAYTIFMPISLFQLQHGIYAKLLQPTRLEKSRGILAEEAGCWSTPLECIPLFFRYDWALVSSTAVLSNTSYATTHSVLSIHSSAAVTHLFQLQFLLATQPGLPSFEPPLHVRATIYTVSTVLAWTSTPSGGSGVFRCGTQPRCLLYATVAISRAGRIEASSW